MLGNIGTEITSEIPRNDQGLCIIFIMENKDTVTLGKNTNWYCEKTVQPPKGKLCQFMVLSAAILSAPQLIRVLNSAYTGYKYKMS